MAKAGVFQMDVVKEFNVSIPNLVERPRIERAKRAVRELKWFLSRHLKMEEGKISLNSAVNEELWKGGAANPPRSVKVKVQVLKDGANVFLSTQEIPKAAEKPKKEEAKEVKEKEHEHKHEEQKEAKPAEKAEAKPATGKPVREEKAKKAAP